MKEPLNIETERVDDIPLLIAQMQRMELASLLDKHFPTNGNREGLSLGWVTVIWLTHVLSQADHRMNRVQAWAARHKETLRGSCPVLMQEHDVTDDRLADVLRYLSDDARWQGFEQELMGQLLRVYDLHPGCVRVDTTTASSYATISEDGLLQLGHSKDHRPDLPQLKVALATLDPLGMPVATEVLSGEHADDPLYLPLIARVRAGLKQQGLLYVGDCKMAALDTRASIHAQQDFYLCPLASVQMSVEQLNQEVATRRANGALVSQVQRTNEQGQTICIAQGYESRQTLTAQVEGHTWTWEERRLLVQSQAAAQVAQAGLQSRLQQAQKALSELCVRRQGKARLTERPAVDEAIEETLAHFRVDGLLRVRVQEEVHEQPVRAYRGRLLSVRIQRQFTISSEPETDAIAQAMSQLGWRVYATNHTAEQFSLAQAVEAYRDEYLVERNFTRLKGHPLSLSPLYVQRDDHATGLVRLLTIALRVLTLLEWVVRRQLRQESATLAGLYAGTPKRRTSQPTTEQLLEAFREITLTIVRTPRFLQRHVTALSPLQQQVVTLLGFSPAIYALLGEDSSDPP